MKMTSKLKEILIRINRQNIGRIFPWLRSLCPGCENKGQADYNQGEEK